ncbi:polymorphic outer membrane protein middle domain-containing protein [Chlamydia vaughanii]|uniref:polymorphic outer membrane protein middle domain-containing protein n=1 Tax=Chlamydia vaughanii TaxID=3112552 RepID=UPI0032B186FA
MYRYNSLLLLISLSFFSSPENTFAKERKQPSFQDAFKQDNLFPWSTPTNLEKFFITPLKYQGYVHNLSADVEIIGRDYLFVCNETHAPRGGGISARNLTISNNGPVVFLENMNPGSWGGAIFCEKACYITNNRHGVIFQNNCAGNDAGAIHTDILVIRDNGPVLFLNNLSNWGGAIQNLSINRGDFYLSADYGDIVFNGNFSHSQGGRNALHSTAQLKLQIGARKGFKVAFYDPIENEHPSNHVFTFNPESYHLGTILFSGITIPSDLSIEKNYFSSCKNTTTITNGVVAVEDKAILALFNLTQTEGTLRLGNSAVITTNKSPGHTGTTNNCQLTLTKLALNLPSIIQKGAGAPKIWIYPSKTGSNYSEDNNPTITISGPLTLLDNDNENPFDSLDLSGGITKVPFLYLCENENKKIDVTNLDIEAINDHVHFGYQGIWSPYWEEYTTAGGNTLETANKSHRILYSDWTPTGYIPDPKFQTPLIANTLWQTFYSTMSGLRSLPAATIEEENPAFEFSSQGLGISINQRNRYGKKGFRMESGGYSVGTSSETETHHKLAFSFAQQFSRVKEKITSNKVSSRNYFAGAQIRLPWLHENIVTTGSVAYSYGDHKAKHSYKEDAKNSEGSFYTHSFAAVINCSLQANAYPFIINPFIEAIAFRSSFSTFEETGEFIRKFSLDRPLHTLTIPMGISTQWHQETRFSSIWHLKLAYQPLVYKKSPRVLTKLLASNGMWFSSGTQVSRSAIAANLKNETFLSSYLKIFLNYHGEFSSSTFSNYLSIGSSIIF